MPPRVLRRLLAALLLPALLALPAGATWSIVVVNARTGEVAVASATCLERFNLKEGVPVIVVGKGAAAAQSAIDVDASNRRLIFDALMDGQATPQEILSQLRAQDPQHRQRQYGIVTHTGPPVTFTGGQAGAAKGGVAGQVGDYVYAIQGNVLADRAVFFAAEDAFRDTPGDLGQRLMAGMEAARALGGDGRCSCSITRPASCGPTPPNFEKSAHVGFVVIARTGDPDGVCNARRGCATAGYYLVINVAGRNGMAASPDPVFQLQQKYDQWRANRIGRPDGILSTVESVDSLPADGVTRRTVTVRLVDVDGTPLSSGGATVEVSTVDGGPPLATVGEVRDHGDGSYSFPLTAGTQPGVDRFVITASDGFLTATLFPYLEVRHDERAPLHVGFDAISATRGADVPFVVDVPAKPKGHYLILGTLSGTTPGMRRGRLTLPLNPDSFTHTTLVHADDPGLLPGTRGKLDRAGRAEGGFVEPPQELMLALVGQRLDWAALVLGKGPPLATNSVGFDVLP